MSEDEELIDGSAEEESTVSDAFSESEKEVVERPKKRFYSTKKFKILIVFLVIAVALVIGLWGAAPEDYRALEDVMNNSGSYMGGEIKVVGKVGNWTGGQNFTLVGRENETIEVFVIHEREIPDGFAEGKDVVVTGKLENSPGGLIFKSKKQIQVGCPSKY